MNFVKGQFHGLMELSRPGLQNVQCIIYVSGLLQLFVLCEPIASMVLFGHKLMILLSV